MTPRPFRFRPLASTGFILLANLMLSACGVDSAPQPPATKPGITVTGTMSAGIARNGG